MAAAMSARVARHGLTFQPVAWATTAMSPSSSGLSVATKRASPSIATPTTMCLMASSAGIIPSTKGEIGVVVGSQNGDVQLVRHRRHQVTLADVAFGGQDLGQGHPRVGLFAEGVLEVVLRKNLRGSRGTRQFFCEAVCIAYFSAASCPSLENRARPITA